ncbi:MAG: hypothetical protein JXX29_03100 [Deltaproteobacteria bacterium]|nr:hypothetical protein [Deltaproteobacteria bacterium]MBN2670629.1 hypothetical protein [Deltaproteobacteria bacterium]
MRQATILLVLCITLLTASSLGATEPTADPLSRWQFTVDAELNSPLIGAMTGNGNWFDTVAAAARIGIHKKRIGIFAFMEYSIFTEPSYDDEVSNRLLSFGAGTSFDYFHHRMRAMIQIGATALLTSSFQNEAGEIGMFNEIRPAGFVIPLKRVNLQIYPITLSWIMPVLENIPLFYIHYRTAVSVGGTF